MKHLPFSSIYRPDFQVVEQRQGNTSLFPHTEQLPQLWRALNLEFLGGLPPRVARVDERADGYHKLLRFYAAMLFCGIDNAARPDGLHLIGLPDRNLVTQLSIAQQITEHHRLGRCHSFRFYAGPNFSTEIRLSGRRVVFSEHVLQRFSVRVPNPLGHDLSDLLHIFFQSPLVSIPVPHGHGFLTEHRGSILVFPFRESDGEFFVTTCLTINELHSFDLDVPLVTFNQHYGTEYRRPRLRNWIPMQTVINAYRKWEAKTPLTVPAKPRKRSWHVDAARIREYCALCGVVPGCNIVFTDRLPGPSIRIVSPGQSEPQYDEEEGYRKTLPQLDWAQAIAEAYGEIPVAANNTAAVRVAA